MINKKCIFVHVYVHKKGDSQREKNAISVLLRFLHSENLGHLKEYG